MKKNYLKKVTVEKIDEKISIKIDDILVFESRENYIAIIHKDKSTYLVRNTMKNLEALLDPEKFIRVHRQYIINKNFIVCKANINEGKKTNKRYIVKIGIIPMFIPVSRPNTKKVKYIRTCSEETKRRAFADIRRIEQNV